jgi:hypothetical protein
LINEGGSSTGHFDARRRSIKATREPPSPKALTRWVGWSGVAGSVLLALYFGIPTVVPRLRDLLYGSDNPSTAHVVSVGADYHVLLGAGSWFQGMGALLAVAFFVGLVHLADRGRSLAARFVLIGSAVLLALVAAEMLFTFTWAHAADVGQVASARTAFDLQTHFLQVFPVVAAPTVYLALAAVLRHGDPVLPPVFARLAVVLGVAFAAFGLIGALVPAAGAGTAALAGLQDVWIFAAGVVLIRQSARLRPRDIEVAV